MSERDLKRVDDGHIGVTTAANLMNMSRRHVYRLLDRFRCEGPGGIRHRARGHRPNNAIHALGYVGSAGGQPCSGPALPTPL